MTTLTDVTSKKKPEPSAEEAAAKELVRLAREQGVSLSGPDGLLKQFTRSVLERRGAGSRWLKRDSILSLMVCIFQQMGRRNYLIEGLSGTGKTSVCDELQRRGHHAIHGDRELAYQGDPETGEPTEGGGHEHHIWNVDKVKARVADRDEAVTFFCGGSRNFSKFIDLFDGVFVLEVDLATLNRRLDERPDDEWGGGKPTERELIVRWHQTKEDVPENGVVIDATAPIEHVVDEILRRCQAST